MAFNPITFGKKLARTSGTVGEALARVKPDSPNSATREELAQVRKTIREQFKKIKDAPKAQVSKSKEAKLNKKASGKQEAEARKDAGQKDTPTIARLAQAGAARQKNKKRDFDPEKTQEEAAASATRMSLAFLGQKSKGLQGAYNRIKANLLWLRENDPKSPAIIGLRDELKRLDARGNIDKSVDIKPKRPAGAKTPDEVQADKDKALQRERMDLIKQVSERTLRTNQRKKPKQSKARGGTTTVRKSRMGTHDYRMNKGGLLLSSVDNRKKK
tara:strand:- start:1682 stop:2497 length:816 start_codon:yes stop_codon:yes gene_type:complete